MGRHATAEALKEMGPVEHGNSSAGTTVRFQRRLFGLSCFLAEDLIQQMHLT